MEILLAYLIFINLTGLVFMYKDKSLAIKGEYRISEKQLFTIALLGGAIGIHIGMYTFRHKTKHWNFKILIPMLIILDAYLLYYIFIK